MIFKSTCTPMSLKIGNKTYFTWYTEGASCRKSNPFWRLTSGFRQAISSTNIRVTEGVHCRESNPLAFRPFVPTTFQHFDSSTSLFIVKTSSIRLLKCKSKSNSSAVECGNPGSKTRTDPGDDVLYLARNVPDYPRWREMKRRVFSFTDGHVSPVLVSEKLAKILFTSSTMKSGKDRGSKKLQPTDLTMRSQCFTRYRGVERILS